MAQTKRKNTKTTSNSKKAVGNRSSALGNSRKKQDSKAPETKQGGLNSRVKDEIISILMVALGIFLVIAFQTSAAGAVGMALSDFFKGCFGFAAYILPYYFIIYGVLLFAKKTINAGVKSSILLLIIFLTFSLVNSGRFINADAPEFSFGDVAVHYSNGIVLDDGGVFGMTVGGIIVKLIGLPGLYIFSIVVIVICFLLVMNTPVSRFIEKIKNQKVRLEEDREARKREKEAQLQEKERRKAMEIQQMEMDFGSNLSDRQRKILGYVKEESMENSRDSYNAEEAESESRRSFSSIFEEKMAAVHNRRETESDAGEYAETPKKQPKEENEAEKFKKSPVIIGGFSPKAAEEKISKSEAAKSTLNDEDFNVHTPSAEDYSFPPVDLLKKGQSDSSRNMDSEGELRRKAAKLENTLRSFNIDADVTNVTQALR